MASIQQMMMAVGRLYTKWNSADKSANCTLSNNDLTATCATTTNGVRSTISKTSGKWYWEVSASQLPVANNCGFGVANSTATLTSMNGTDSNSLTWLHVSGIFFNNVQLDATTFTTGDVIGIAYDSGAGTVAFYKNNTLTYTASGANVPTGALFAAHWGNNTVTTSIATANFGASALTYTPPSGYNYGLYQ